MTPLKAQDKTWTSNIGVFYYAITLHYIHILKWPC